MEAGDPPPAAELRRTLSLPLITLYGIGTIVGGGIYALLGKVAGVAGMAAPASFLMATAVAAACAISFAELSARYPVSAGEAQYVKAAFGTRWLGPLVGLLVISTGTVSAATLANAVGQFLVELTDWPHALNVCIVVSCLTLVAAWGIAESVTAAAIITLIEVGGLVAVLVLRGGELGQLSVRWSEVVLPDAAHGWSGLALGAFLAFYAYIGFEDMVNVAEEVREPQRNLPIAILAALGLTSLLYVLICLVAVLALPPEELARSRIPLADILGTEAVGARGAMSAISVLAGVNGALIQIVMASRIVYGLRRHAPALQWLAVVNVRTQTPIRATVLIATLVLVLALRLPLETLARAASTIILTVFTLVNLALIRIRLREAAPPAGVRTYPLWIPVAGALLCVALLVFRAGTLLGFSSPQS
ncbi:MAG: amino acid permease [bacterium]|nr:amino acid permease [bacterium]